MLSKDGWQREICNKRGKVSHLSLTQLPFWNLYSSSYPVFAEQTLVHFQTGDSLVGVTNPVGLSKVDQYSNKFMHGIVLYCF